MNNFIISFFLLILSVSFFSQPKKPHNKFSIETTFGYSNPLRNKYLNDNGHYASFTHIDFGLRYRFNKNWGAKSAINYDTFKERNIGFFLIGNNNNKHPILRCDKISNKKIIRRYS